MLSQTQIQQIKSLKAYSPTRFHGNTKKVGDLPIELYKSIVLKKITRQVYRPHQYIKPTIYSKVRIFLLDYKRNEGTSYSKTLIEGNTGIYLASPIYLHSDYNKCRVFDKNEQTLRLMEIYNSLINK